MADPDPDAPTRQVDYLTLAAVRLTVAGLNHQ
jgi:hypothetical protein